MTPQQIEEYNKIDIKFQTNKTEDMEYLKEKLEHIFKGYKQDSINFITTLLEKQREEYVEIINKTRLPQNSSSNGMTTLMYIPNEPFNIEINKRIDWIIDKIKFHDKTS